MDENVPLSAAGRDGSSADGFIIASRGEFPMFLYLAVVNEREAAHEGGRRQERLIAAEGGAYQSLPSGSSAGTHHSRVRSRAEG